jgi:hypothetical protein
MSNYLITKSGVKVYRRWEDNIIVDSHLPAIQWKASQKKDRFTSELPKLASVNSEDALSWNLFRTLEKYELLDALANRLGFPDTFHVLYWHRPLNQRDPEAGILPALDKIEPWGRGGRRQQTETDIVLRGEKYLLMIESKLGRPGEKVKAWNRKTKGLIPQDYKCYVQPLLVKPGNWEETLQCFYQLLRNMMLGCELARTWSLKPHLVAIVNRLNFNWDGRSHEEEFNEFRKAINVPESVYLFTWQYLRDEIAAMDKAVLQRLLQYLNKHPCLTKQETVSL